MCLLVLLHMTAPLPAAPCCRVVAPSSLQWGNLDVGLECLDLYCSGNTSASCDAGVFNAIKDRTVAAVNLIPADAPYWTRLNTVRRRGWVGELSHAVASRCKPCSLFWLV